MSFTLTTGVTVTVDRPQLTISMAPPAGPNILVLPKAGPQGPPGAGTAELEAHINSPTPHPAYDTDMQSLSVVFENGLT
jgi:hypothetical protein